MLQIYVLFILLFIGDAEFFLYVAEKSPFSVTRSERKSLLLCKKY
ncbi:hypothetical protein M094_3006 [Bacteroides uniformis str. 3978 T3 ii]|uniref:Uncharacterized protein n=1 Tax=Bacteroides uniformis str. 3978 T3 ii TaxID=1339349 RepID=A0A078RUD0_BACUN|nr:hypothetical protein M094_3006 [Bacteroides uniformis str. 3978 T3 ii]